MVDTAAYTVAASATLLETAKVIEAGKARTALVVDPADPQKLIGIVSEGDILRALLKGADPRSPVRDSLRLNFRYLRSHDMEAALPLFLEHNFGLLPVVDDDMRLLSVITALECFRHRCSLS